MKTLKVFALVCIIGFIVFNTTTLKINIKSSDMSINTATNVALADDEGGGIHLCYEWLNAGIGGFWQCVPCTWMSFVYPGGRNAYCLP